MTTSELLLKYCPLFVVLIAAVYTDIAHGKIYNWCTLPAIALGLLVNLALGGLWQGEYQGANLGSSLLACGLVLVIFGWPYLRGAIAAGDVKLMLAVGALGGFHRMFIVRALVFTAIIGAVMALVAVIARGRLAEGLKGALRFTFSLKRLPETDGSEEGASGRIAVRYGVAISIGSIIAWFLSVFPV